MMADKRASLVIGVLALLGMLAVVLWLQGPEGGGRSAPEPAPSREARSDFAVLECAARLFDDRPALAVILTQPIDGRQPLSEVLRVTDLGPSAVAGTAGSAPASAASGAASGTVTGPVPGAAADGGRIVEGDWTIGDNPRLLYFPYVQPQRRLRVDIAQGLRSIDGDTLPAALDCEVASEAMPPSFQFASRGVVLPAGQNGGLPIVTVNVPEVDVQFLRIEPVALPRFLEQVAGVRRSQVPAHDPSTSNEDEDEDEGARRSTLQGSVSGWELDQLREAARSVYLGRFRTDQAPDKRSIHFLDVESIRELQEPGVYLAVMSQPGRFQYEYQVSYFYVSDIGLHLRRYAQGMQAFATSLRSGEALPDVELDLLDVDARRLARVKVDAEGRAAFDTVPASARVLLARRGSSEISLITLKEPGLDLSEFEVGGLPSRNAKLFAYAGRDLYRPGERFTVSVLARNADGKPLEPLPLSAVLKRPDGRSVRGSSWPVDPARPGYFQRTVELPADAPTGRWTLELRHDPSARQADTVFAFQVEEFLPERLKLQLRHEPPVLGPQDPFEVAVQGDYLYGSPAAGNRLIASVATERLRFALPQAWPGFVFGDVSDDTRKGREEVGETTLDARGAALVRLPTRPGPGAREGGPLNSPMRLRGSFSLLESGGRPVVRSIDRSLWPAPQLLALRPLFERDVTREDQAAGFELIRVDAQGRFAPLPAGQTATLRLLREERHYHWRHDDQKGWHAGWTDTDELVDTRTLALPERARLDLPVRYGRYRLEVDDPQTGLTLRYRFYAGWSAQEAEAIGNRPDRVQLQLADLPLRPGKSFRATVRPPHDGHALITVEGDRLLWSRRIAVSAAGTPIEIPIDPNWARHDLYLGVTAFRPGSGVGRITPARAVGLAHLPLAREDRKLEVAIEAPPRVRPERSTTVKVRVAGAEGPGLTHVTLSAVDVGILDITRYAPPEPHGFFFGKHRYAPEQADLYGKLIEKMDGRTATLRFGGDASARDTRSLPKKVQLVDLFSGPVALDSEGQASIPIQVPDFNGTLRLMAVAFTPERYGSAQVEMVAAAPVVAEMAMPRFVSPGDAATVALDLTNLSGSAQALRVSLDGDELLRLGEGTRELRLADGQRQTLRFPVQAVGAAGLGRLRLSIEARGGPEPLLIRREAALQVQPPVPLQRETRHLLFQPGASLALDAPALGGLFADSASVSVAISDRPPLNLQRMVRGLFEYPYGCLEQTTSAAYPYLYLDDKLAQQLGMPAQPLAQRAEAVESALGRIAGLQRASGGYTLWGEGPQALWLSAYVAGFLQDAVAQGFAVPELQLRRGREWLLQQLLQAPNRFPELPASLRAAIAADGASAPASAAAPSPSATVRPRVDPRDLELLRDGHQRFAELAHAGYVLAREQQAPLASLRVLHDRYRDRARSPLPLVHLAIALKLMGDAPRAAVALEDAMRRPYGVAAAFGPGGAGDGAGEWLGDYGSAVRDTALSYALLVRHEVAHARREALLFEAADRIAGRRDLSTQERFALFQAGRVAGLGASGPGRWQARLVHSGGEEVLGGADTEQRSLDPAQWRPGARPPRLTNNGQRPLFVELEVSGYPVRAPAPRRDEIELERRWFTAAGEPWSGREPRVGETLVVELKARSRQRLEDALIVDRIPAGFEVENLNLSQGEQAGAFVVDGRNVAEAMADARLAHTEFRDDRYVAAARLDREWLRVYYLVRVVSPGRFVVPAPYAEDMYRPELYGVGLPGAPVVIVDPTGSP